MAGSKFPNTQPYDKKNSVAWEIEPVSGAGRVHIASVSGGISIGGSTVVKIDSGTVRHRYTGSAGTVVLPCGADTKILLVGVSINNSGTVASTLVLAWNTGWETSSEIWRGKVSPGVIMNFNMIGMNVFSATNDGVSWSNGVEGVASVNVYYRLIPK